jgi:subtilisin-like proprotein convertase family protein
MSVSADVPVIRSYSFSDGFAAGGVILDGNPTGWSDSRLIEDWPSGFSITDVTVSLHITGGLNGDLYAYLAHDSGFAVLLNRVGRTDGNAFGYNDAGFNITLHDSAPGDIHLYGGNDGNLLTGIWQPDGRNVDPATVTDASPRTAMLSEFQGLDPAGTWVLFVADMSAGGVSVVNSWGLEVAAVPEPGTLALGVIGAALCLAFMRRQWNSNPPRSRL